MLANLAHELRTPAQVLIGYLEILRDDLRAEVSASVRPLIERMQANALDLAHAVDNVLDFACAQLNRDEPADEDIDLRELLEELVPALDIANHAKGLELRFDLDRAPVSVRTRRRALRAILLNLALNAIKFTERGSVTIRAIEKPCADGQTPAVHFEVIDTGTGIQAALLKQAFEPWEQLSTSSTRRYRGLGLGLAVVRRNVIQLGGSLKVESAPEQGSRFLVVIPKQPAHRKPVRRAQPIFNATSGPDAPAGTRDVAPRAHPTSARD